MTECTCAGTLHQPINQIEREEYRGRVCTYIAIYDKCLACGKLTQDAMDRECTYDNRDIGRRKIDKEILAEQGLPRDQQRIVAAACRNRKGELIVSARHWDMLMHKIAQSSANPADWYEDDWDEQGFIDQWGTYLTREEAHIIASQNGQILRRCGGDEYRLYSENLY